MGINQDLLNDGEKRVVEKLDFGSTWKNKILMRYLIVLNFYQMNVENRDNPNFLDLGCSNGKLLKLYQDHFRSPSFNNPNYIGVDANKKFIKKAREYLEENKNRNFYDCSKFIQANITSEDLWEKLSKNQYEFVVMMEVIEHIPFNEHDWLISQIYDSMKDGAYFVISTPVHYNKNEEMYYPEDHFKEYYIEDFKNLVSNFEIVKEFGFNIKSRSFKKKLRERNRENYELYKKFNDLFPYQLTLPFFDLALSKAPEFLVLVLKK